MKTNTTYTFTTKDGRTYAAGGKNRFEAQDSIELQWGVSLKGATFTETYKLRTVRTGTVK